MVKILTLHDSEMDIKSEVYANARTMMGAIAGGACYWQELADRGGVGGYPWPQVRALLRYWTGDSRALHLALVVNNHPRVVLKVDELPVLPPESLPLPDNYRRHHLLPQLWLALQNKSQHSVPLTKREFTFLTEARTMSPLQPAGSLFSLPLIPYTAMTYL